MKRALITKRVLPDYIRKLVRRQPHRAKEKTNISRKFNPVANNICGFIKAIMSERGMFEEDFYCVLVVEVFINYIS